MLMNGRYPSHLKRRISGGNGHLSNNQALQLFVHHRPAFMSHLFLSHLSRENNNPELVQQMFDPYSRSTEIVVASRYRETPLYNVAGSIKVPLTVKPAQVQ